jgi:predicted ATPase
VLDAPVGQCLPLIDEAVEHGLLDRVGDAGDYRFVHALTRDAIAASLTTSGQAALHRRVAEAMEQRFAANLSDPLADIAWHWSVLAPYGEAATARRWMVRAAAEAVRRLAYEEGVRLYRAALKVDAAGMGDAERCEVLVALAARRWNRSPAACAPGLPGKCPRSDFACQ